MATARTAAAHVGKLLEGVADGVCLIDEDREVVFCNAACARWLCVHAESLLGVQCNYHSRPDMAEADRAAATVCPPPEVFAGGHADAVASNPAGEPRSLRFVPLAGETGEVTLVLVMVSPTPADHAKRQGDDLLLHDALREFRARQAHSYSLDQLIGTSPLMARVRERVRLASESSASVLIEGLVGTGREHVARTIHERGGNPFGPLIALACATLPTERLVSTLEKTIQNYPAHTTAAAPGGTLLLADIDLLPREANLPFVRLLIPRQTSLRIVSTCTQSLSGLAEDCVFPQALVYALSEIEIHLPPLAARKQDIPLLAQALLEEVNAEGGKQVSGFLPEALDLLVAHSWPRNLYDLADAVREAHELAAGANITPRDLPKSVVLAAEATARPKKAEDAIDLIAFLERIERELIERALARAKGNKSRAAKMLGMTRPKFYRRVEQLNLPHPS